MLDARRSDGEYAVIENPLASLNELFNDYDYFSPQNLMIHYTTSAPGGRPTKICPYQAHALEWTFLAMFTNELDPTILALKNIIRGPE